MMGYIMDWEAELVHVIASLSKKIIPHTRIVVQGQMPTLVGEYVLCDRNIDFGIIGEGEIAVLDLLYRLENRRDFCDARGVIYRDNGNIVKTTTSKYIENLDEFCILPDIWDLINIKKYAKYQNWNGSLREEFYIPILSSRGCPFDCIFCCIRDMYGKKFRARSPENVVSEIKSLYEKFNCREFHFFDPVFNYDLQRAKKICQLIKDTGLNISLAFPHGLRADLMDEELIKLLKSAGTYKLVYGIETSSARLQKKIRKNLNLEDVKKVIEKTSRAGIIVGGYFMLGFPEETKEEMEQTIQFAIDSELDIASFFKMTSFQEAVKYYKSVADSINETTKVLSKLKNFSYYSRDARSGYVSERELNTLILKAQRRFYLNFRRFKRGLMKYPDRFIFVRNFINATALIIQGYLETKLLYSASQSTTDSG